MGGLRCGRKVQGYFNLCFAVQNSRLKLGGSFLSFSQVGFENSPLTYFRAQGLGRWGPPRACEMYQYISIIMSLQKLPHYV